MSSKAEILNNLKQHINSDYDMPEIKLDALTYNDKIKIYLMAPLTKVLFIYKYNYSHANSHYKL